MFAALRIDSLCANFLTFLFSYTFTQLGGIPRATDANGNFFWLAWVLTQLAQFVTTLTTLAFRVCEFLSVRETLYPCLIEVDGVRLLDAYAMVTFPVQTGVVMNLVLLFSNGYLLALAALVLDGSRKWPWIKYYYNMRKNAAAPVLYATRWHSKMKRDRVAPSKAQSRSDATIMDVDEPPGEPEPSPPPSPPAPAPAETSALKACQPLRRAALQVRRRLTIAPVPKAEFVREATDAKTHKEKHFKARFAISQTLYHLLRWNTFAAAFSAWAIRGNLRGVMGGVVASWTMAAVVAAWVNYYVNRQRSERGAFDLESLRNRIDSNASSDSRSIRPFTHPSSIPHLL